MPRDASEDVQDGQREGRVRRRRPGGQQPCQARQQRGRGAGTVWLRAERLQHIGAQQLARVRRRWGLAGAVLDDRARAAGVSREAGQGVGSMGRAYGGSGRGAAVAHNVEERRLVPTVEAAGAVEHFLLLSRADQCRQLCWVAYGMVVG